MTAKLFTAASAARNPVRIVIVVRDLAPDVHPTGDAAERADGSVGEIVREAQAVRRIGKVLARLGVRSEESGGGEAERQKPIGVRNAEFRRARPDIALIGGEAFDGTQGEIFVSLVVLRSEKSDCFGVGFAGASPAFCAPLFAGVGAAVLCGRGSALAAGAAAVAINASREIDTHASHLNFIPSSNAPR